VADALSKEEAVAEITRAAAIDDQATSSSAADTQGTTAAPEAGLAAGWIDDPIDQAEARRQFNRAMRDSESLSEELKEEVIQLLQAMNLPYLVAPFEAEAQCAVLEQVRNTFSPLRAIL
jgi:5'-3' exonuclease